MTGSVATTASFSLDIDDLINKAFRRLGGEQVTGLELRSAKQQLNLIAMNWGNKGINLWTVKRALLGSIQGKTSWTLPQDIIDILEISRRSVTRVTDGTPATSAGGTASLAFDGDYATSCTQTSADGNISYVYTDATTIQLFGIRFNTGGTFALVWEASNDTFVTIDATTTIASQSYDANVTYWFDPSVIVSATDYRVRETGGGTLDVEEVYFDNNLSDIPLSRIARDEYQNLPNKASQDTPVQFYIDRQRDAPVMYLWPMPNVSDTMVFAYNGVRRIKDFTAYSGLIDAPPRFIQALISQLAFDMSYERQGVDPTLRAELRAQAAEDWDVATAEDRDRSAMTIAPDLSSYVRMRR